MAFVSRFVHDIFVSYAHADDIPNGSGQGWVSQFVACLEIALRQRLGGSNELRLYFDRSHLHANHQADELLAAACNSAVFLAVASRSYAMRPWTQDELRAFLRRADDLHRLFAVECLPLDEGESYSPPLQTHKRASFWHVNAPHSLTPMPLSATTDAVQFHQRVHDVAEQIRKQLVLLRGAPEGGDATDRSAVKLVGTPSPRRTVLLAQATDDLEDEREQLRRYLEQYGVPILPLDTYPQDGARFREAFEADLQRADLFVQLLGTYGGRCPSDLPEGYTRAQFAMAAVRGAEILQWRRPDLVLDSVMNAFQRELLTGEYVVASGFESFKAEVLARATRPPPVSVKPAAGALVFVNADRDDLTIAKQIQKEFQNHAFSTAIPLLEGSAEEIRSDLEENLIDCDALVLVYGQTSPMWVRGQFRLYNKMKAKRSVPPRLLALYCGPPANKQDIGFTLPEVREIDGRNVPTVQPVLPLIEVLKA